MDRRDTALVTAGLIGSGLAVMHGVLVQRLMVRPIEALSRRGDRLPRTVRRLVPLLLHFSTACWFLSGFALIADFVLPRSGGEAGDRSLRRRVLLLWRARQPLCDVRPPPRVDADGGRPCTYPHRPRRDRISAADLIQVISIAASGEAGLRLVIVTVVPWSVMA